MRAVRHPHAPFQFTLPDPGLRRAVVLALLLATAAGVGPALAGLDALTAAASALVVLVVAAGALVPRPRVVAHVDRHGIVVTPPATQPDDAAVGWLDVVRIEVAAGGGAHLLVVHGHDGPLARVRARESAPATIERLEAAKVAGLVPGWVRIDAAPHEVVRGVRDRGPRPRPDLAA